jgi:hypothetical protein
MMAVSTRRRAALAAVMSSLSVIAGCASSSRWTEQWVRLPSAVRDVDGAASDANALAIGNRGLRFGERLLLVAEPVQAASIAMAGNDPVRVRCRSAPEECYGYLIAPSGEREGRLVLILRGVMTRFAAVERLYLETEAGEAALAVGPFETAYQLDLSAPGTVRPDALALSCVSAEADVLARAELSRANADLQSERINSDEAAAMSKALLRYVGLGGRLCKPGRANTATPGDRR